MPREGGSRRVETRRFGPRRTTGATRRRQTRGRGRGFARRDRLYATRSTHDGAGEERCARASEA